MSGSKLMTQVVKQMFTEYPLCARNYARHWEHSSAQTTYLLSAYYVPDTISSTRNRTINNWIIC